MIEYSFNLFDFVYNNLNCRSKSLSSFWSELNVKPKYLISSVNFGNLLSIYNLGHDNLYDLGLNTMHTMRFVRI